MCVRSGLELLYNLTADVDKRQKSLPSRIYFIQSGSQISQKSEQLKLDINKDECQSYTAYVKVSFDGLVPVLACFLCRWTPINSLLRLFPTTETLIMQCDIRTISLWSLFWSWSVYFRGQVHTFPVEMFMRFHTNKQHSQSRKQHHRMCRRLWEYLTPPLPSVAEVNVPVMRLMKPCCHRAVYY